MTSHVPVMVKEAVYALNCRKGGVYVDCTLGEGGHAEEILKAILPGGFLIGIDQDSEALARASEKLKPYKEGILLVQKNFSEIVDILGALHIEQVDGFLFDLGVSSLQLENPSRGFSFQLDGPLDMRMSQKRELTARHLVNRLPQNDLERILADYGQERWARRIARRIVLARRRTPIETTLQLVEIVKQAVPREFWPRRINVATRTFQALRIAVNEELVVLEKTLPKVFEFLKKGGRICVISYHSLEDRIVKRFFRDYKVRGLRAVFPKPITPTQEECVVNPRARSAKLRAAEKIEVSLQNGTEK